jgi:hypothetical protein
MTSALYNTATGNIQSTVSPSLSNTAQIAALLAAGTGVLEVPAGTNGVNSMVDLSTNPPTLVAVTANPSVPSLVNQFIAASINSGTVPASAFHPASIADLNVSLSAANLTAVSASSGPGTSTTPPATPAT